MACNENVVLTADKVLPGFPSGSALEYKRGKFYLFGDDASQMLVMDSNFKVIDSLSFFHSREKRIPKNIKADIEAASFLFGDRTHIFCMGSGSLPPYRDTAFLIETQSKQHSSFLLDTFFARLKNKNIREINIEGAASLPWGMMLSNRGHKGYPKNFLIATDNDFYKNQQEASLQVIPIGNNKDTAVFEGISGMCYSGMSDRLIMTVSTENTYSTHADGAIGKSYLWIIDDISAKRRFSAINPNKVIELSTVDKKLQGQKIESVCIIKETNKTLWLALAADNDDGTTSLFQIQVKK